MTINNNKIINWILPKPINKVENTNSLINLSLQRVLSRRGLDKDEEIDRFLIPPDLPKPEDHFKDLNKASIRVIEALNNNEKIAICGDYDADGITSTALLVELLSKLGANVVSFIPSRQEEGYGINTNIINKIHRNKISLIITVDNGISALDAIQRAHELSIDLIITDHHKISNNNLNIFSLIHPENAPVNSPYKYLAGVGIAYMLAINLCRILNYDINKTSAKVLFCIGTIADMAPLLGANRKWLKDFLPLIAKTNNKGIKQILIKLKLDNKEISTEDIGFKIAPLINAVGRIGEPSLVVNLLTNTSNQCIKQLVNDCFQLHLERRQMTKIIEKNAYEIAKHELDNMSNFIVIYNKEWHPGIIGIVASRFVDKFNLPTAIISGANDGLCRGSVRSNDFLKVNFALDECKDILQSYGGHSSAAGFTIKEENIIQLRKLLNDIAFKQFNNKDIRKKIKPESYLLIRDIDDDFYNQMKLLGPFGIHNPAPIFWTRKCRILNVYMIKGNHLKISIDDGTGKIDCIKWNNSIKVNKNDLIDIAFNIYINEWKNKPKIELNLLDIKIHSNIVDLQIHNKIYKCQLTDNKNIIITNSKGEYIRSDLETKSNNKKHKLFEKKIFSLAEVALGKAA